jgi:SAM (Sterile alpha motif) domain-containing protein
MTSRGATIDVGAWLLGLGFGPYEARLRQNEIDIDILPELTEPDLERGPVVIVKSEKFSQASAPVRVQK